VPDRYTSRIALVLDAPVADLAALLRAARDAGDIDRASPLPGDPTAQQVHWGGRMQTAVVRPVTDEDDGAGLLRTETYIGGDGPVYGVQRQAALLQGLARQSGVKAVRDLSAMTDRDAAWLNRCAAGAVEQDDAIDTVSEGEGTWWVRTHGAARFDVPDLELYGLPRAKVAAAERALAHVHGQLLEAGLKSELSLPDGAPVYLVPVLQAWNQVPLDWPGVGQDRGPGLDGPRATLSVLHRPRFGRYRTDLDGVVEALAS